MPRPRVSIGCCAAIVGITTAALGQPTPATDAVGVEPEPPYIARVCIDEYPPMTYFVDGRATGAMLDALELIGQRMNFTLLPSPDTPFARCLRMAEAGLTDFMVSLIPTPERLAYLAMFPYAQVEPLRFVALEKNIDKFDALNKIKLTRLGLVNGFLYPEEFHQKHLQTVLAPTAEAGIRLLRSHRIDVLLLNQTVAAHLVQREQQNPQQLTQPISLLALDYEREANANSIALSRKSPLMAREAELAAVIQQLRQDGTFTKLIEKYQSQP